MNAPGPGVAGGEPVCRELEHLSRRHVEEHRTRAREVGERRDARPGLDPGAERAQLRDEGIGEPAGAAANDGPAVRVAENPEHDPEGGGSSRGERQHRVRGEPREERPRTRAAEGPAREPVRGAERGQPEAREEERVARHAQRPEHVVHQRVRAVDERAEETDPRVPVAVVEPGGRQLDGALEHHGRAVVERVRERRGRMHELRQRELP